MCRQINAIASTPDYLVDFFSHSHFLDACDLAANLGASTNWMSRQSSTGHYFPDVSLLLDKA